MQVCDFDKQHQSTCFQPGLEAQDRKRRGKKSRQEGLPNNEESSDGGSGEENHTRITYNSSFTKHRSRGTSTTRHDDTSGLIQSVPSQQNHASEVAVREGSIASTKACIHSHVGTKVGLPWRLGGQTGGRRRGDDRERG